MAGSAAEMHHLVDHERSMRAAKHAAGVHDEELDSGRPLARSEALARLAEVRRQLTRTFDPEIRS